MPWLGIRMLVGVITVHLFRMTALNLPDREMAFISWKCHITLPTILATKGIGGFPTTFHPSLPGLH